MYLDCGVLEVILVPNLIPIWMTPQNVKTNLAWDRLSLEPITTTKLKPMLRSGLVRIALATEPGLRFITLTRHPRLAGRRAKRVQRGWWEAYEAGKGWVSIENSCHIWLHP
jgi:hypothetical protein